MTILSLAGLMVFSFWWIDRAMANWKKEQDAKLEEIRQEIIKLRM